MQAPVKRRAGNLAPRSRQFGEAVPFGIGQPARFILKGMVQAVELAALFAAQNLPQFTRQSDTVRRRNLKAL